MSSIVHSNAMNNLSCDAPMFPLLSKIFFFIPLIYGIPTIILYFHIIYVIMRNSHLCNEFYKLYVLYSVLTVTMWIWDMTTTRFIGIGYWCDEMLRLWGTPNYFLTPFQFVMTYSRHSQFYAATVLALNRMTAVAFPLRYTEVWQKHFNYGIFAVLLLPLATTWYIIPAPAVLNKCFLGALELIYHKFLPNPWNSTSALTAIVGAVCSFFMIIATVTTSTSLRKFNRERQKEMDKQERGQLIVGIISSVTACSLAIVEIPIHIIGNYILDDPSAFFAFQCIKEIMIDILLVFSPWTTIFVSSTMRRALRDSYVRPKKRKSIVDVTNKGMPPWNTRTAALVTYGDDRAEGRRQTVSY